MCYTSQLVSTPVSLERITLIGPSVKRLDAGSISEVVSEGFSSQEQSEDFGRNPAPDLIRPPTPPYQYQKNNPLASSGLMGTLIIRQSAPQARSAAPAHLSESTGVGGVYSLAGIAHYRRLTDGSNKLSIKYSAQLGWR